MADCYINVQSTSATSATTSPLLLNETDLLRLQFLPTLADNQKEPCKSVSGKILFEKKPKNAPCFQVMSVTKVQKFRVVQLKSAIGWK